MNPTLPLGDGPDAPQDRIPAPEGPHRADRTRFDDGRDDDGYSATVLGSHWFDLPEPPERSELPGPVVSYDEEVRPDRVDGTLLRFGPGVTAVLAHRTAYGAPGTLPGAHPLPGPAQPRRLRRHALPALILLLALALLAWQRGGPGLAVHDIKVTTGKAFAGCDETADITGTVTTNGRAGTLTYRWIRSDGTTSGVLYEKVPDGEKRAVVHLLWTFQGTGHYEATAQLRVITPVQRTVGTRLTYDCEDQ